MKNYAKTIPKPPLDPKNFLKEKISQAMDRQQQQSSSSVASHLGEEEGNVAMDSTTTINSYSNTPKRRSSYIPIPAKEKRKSKSGNKQKKNSRVHSAKYSEIEGKRKEMSLMLEEEERENSLSTIMTTGLSISSTSKDTSLNSMEEALATAIDPTNIPKNNDLVLPPISPTQLQLWNLEQEHRKAMSKVETIKKELNL